MAWFSSRADSLKLEKTVPIAMKDITAAKWAYVPRLMVFTTSRAGTRLGRLEENNSSPLKRHKASGHGFDALHLLEPFKPLSLSKKIIVPVNCPRSRRSVGRSHETRCTNLSCARRARGPEVVPALLRAQPKKGHR